MRFAALALLVVACSHPKPPVGPAPVVPEPVAVVPKRESPWPVPMRVMTWTSQGVVQIGELPDAPPNGYPARWYVEPTVRIDRPAFDKIIAAVRSEHVPGLSLEGQPVSGWLGALRDLPELTALILTDTAIGNDDVAATDLSLKRLYLARTQIDDAALTARMATLEVLDVEDCAITDGGLQVIAGFGELQALDVAGTRITDRGGAVLGALTKLGVLDLGGTKIGAATIAAIRPLALTELFIDHTAVGKEIATLDGYAPGIVRFDASALATYKPTDADVGWLARAPNLIEVGLSGSLIHDPLAISIASHRELRVLRLAGTPLTAAAIQPITKLDRLEEIDLASLPVDDATAAVLLALPHVRVLRLDDTPITDAALGEPARSLRELYISRTKVTAAGLAILDKLPLLEGLGLATTDVDDATIARVARLGQLRTLVLTDVKASRPALRALGALKLLERLYLANTRADDDVLAALAGIDLEVLHLAGTDVSPVALPVLRGFVHLDELTLGDTRMTSAITDLGAWPHLRTLSVVGLAIGDGALPAIARRTSLATIDLSATDVTDPSALTSLPNLRTLGLSNTQLSTAGTATATALARAGVEIVR